MSISYSVFDYLSQGVVSSVTM